MNIYKQEQLIRRIMIQVILALPAATLKPEYRNKSSKFWEELIKLEESINLDYIMLEKSKLERLRSELVLLIDINPKTELSL